jgi:hypothetical protein
VSAASLMALGLLLLVLNAYAYKAPEVGIARTIVLSKKTAAAGVLYLAIGAIVIACSTRFADRLTGVGARLTQRPGTALLVALAIFLPGQLEPLAFWVRSNAPQYADEARYARLGLLVARTTDQDFRIAVVAAGATPYFSRRPTEDMLGKNDKIIAKQAPKGVFSPGHDKWNYEHTLGARKPDLVVEMADETADDTRYVKSLGFVELANKLLYRRGGRRFDAALGGAFASDQELADTLATVPPGRP